MRRGTTPYFCSRPLTVVSESSNIVCLCRVIHAKNCHKVWDVGIIACLLSRSESRAWMVGGPHLELGEFFWASNHPTFARRVYVARYDKPIVSGMCWPPYYRLQIVLCKFSCEDVAVVTSETNLTANNFSHVPSNHQLFDLPFLM